MNLLMISGDRSVVEGKKSAFWYMLEEFSKYWGRVDIICPRANVQGDGIRNVFGNVYFHPSSKGLLSQPAWIVKKGRELIKEHGHSVMSVHDYPPFYNGIGSEWLSRKMKVPYVLEVHHIVGYPHPASFVEWIGKIMSHLFLAHDTYGAKAVRCVSRGTAKILRKWGSDSDSVYIVPSFYLDKDLLRPQPCVKDYDLVCCGRLVSNKGINEIIEAVSITNEAKLLIVGDGPLRLSLEKKAEDLGVSDRVKFAGWLPENEDVYKAIQSAKVFVMNSKSEGGPRVALEAMALGMPIISTKVGVTPDVIRDEENGLFTTGSAKDLAEKINKFLDYPTLRERLGKEAREVLDKFEKESLIREYAEFLQKMAK